MTRHYSAANSKGWPGARRVWCGWHGSRPDARVRRATHCPGPGAAPDINLEIRTGSSTTFRGWLLQREVDMVLAAPLEPTDPAIEAELVFETESVIVAHPDHPMFKGPPPGIRESIQVPCCPPIPGTALPGFRSDSFRRRRRRTTPSFRLLRFWRTGRCHGGCSAFLHGRAPLCICEGDCVRPAAGAGNQGAAEASRPPAYQSKRLSAAGCQTGAGDGAPDLRRVRGQHSLTAPAAVQAQNATTRCTTQKAAVAPMR